MRKKYTPEFKAKLVLEMLTEGLLPSQLAAGYGVHVTLVNKWKKTAEENLWELFAEKRKREDQMKEHEEERQELYAQIGELTTKLNWLKKKSGIKL
jgi:putative transposase